MINFSEQTCLEQIIDQQNVNIEFQPIFDIATQQILGYEALTRGPANSPYQSPFELFALADRLGRLSELELICRKEAIHRYVELELGGKLFLNVSPAVLLDAQHPKGETLQLLRYYGLAFERVVIEVTERQKVDDTLLKQAVNYYRDLGFTIAIDDLGVGHSGLQQWSELLPDIIKIDRYFIQNCHIDIVKKAFLRSIIFLAEATNARVIAEGIEQYGELKLLLGLGVSYVQGYLLEMPQANPSKYFPAHINDALGRFAVEDTSAVRSPMKLRQA